MPDTFTFPENAELLEIAQDKIRVLTQDDPIFTILPITDSASPLLIWEQEDNDIGLQQVRGLGGVPSRVQRTGAKRYAMEPGIYGEFIRLDETELTLRRPLGVWAGGVPITDMVLRAQDQLLGRRVDRIRYIGWQLIANGVFSVALPKGGIAHTDAFPLQTFVPTVLWTLGTRATATPLADFRAVKLLARGHSISFGSDALAFMNQSTFNTMMLNTNPEDLAGQRMAGLASIFSMAEVNQVLMSDGLPRIQIYDNTYYDENGDVQLFLADGVVDVIGRRPGGQRIGEYRMTKNLNAPSGIGAYMKTIIHNDEVPISVDVHDGHNGGPVIAFPSAIVRMNVS